MASHGSLALNTSSWAKSSVAGLISADDVFDLATLRAIESPRLRDVLSAWCGHVPFLQALLALARPRIFVELGAHHGMSYCAACQAVERLGLGTLCFAVDTWKGDEHAHFYGEEVYSNLRRYHNERYLSFSHLFRSTFDEAVNQFSDGTIDLLHIDGLHTYEAVRHDYETWLPKMSDRGVILFHDIGVRHPLTFGVWRLWEELRATHPHFEFWHSHGLGVLGVGKAIPEKVTTLFSLDKVEGNRVREAFTRFGQTVQDLNQESISTSQLRMLLEQQSQELQARQCELDARETNLNQLAKDLENRHNMLRYRVADASVASLRRVPFAVSALKLMVSGLRHLKRCLLPARQV